MSPKSSWKLAGIILFAWLGSGLLAWGQMDHAARVQSEINAARTLAAENASQSRAQLQREFSRIDRNLEAANEWLSAAQAADSRRMNAGVDSYLKMVHENEARERAAAEKRSKEAKEWLLKTQREFAESMARTAKAEQEWREHRKERAEQALRDAAQREYARLNQAARSEATVAEQIEILELDWRQGRRGEPLSGLNESIRMATEGKVTPKQFFWPIIQNLLRHANDNLSSTERNHLENSVSLAIGDLAVMDLCTNLELPELVAAMQVAEKPFCMSPSNYVMSFQTLAHYRNDGERVLTETGARALMKQYYMSKLTPRGWNTNAVDRQTLSLILWKTFGHPVAAAHCFDYYELPPDRDFQDLATACKTAAVLNGDELELPEFWRDVHRDWEDQALAGQIEILKTAVAGQALYFEPLAAIMKLRSAFRHKPYRQKFPGDAEYGVAAGLQARVKYGVDVYDEAVTNYVNSASKDLEAGQVVDDTFGGLWSDINRRDNTNALVPALGLLRLAEFKPSWLERPFVEQRAQIVSAWILALRESDATNRAALLQRYPAILADPGSPAGEPRLDRSLFVKDVELEWSLDINRALLDLVRDCDPATGALPKNPDRWVSELKRSTRCWTSYMLGQWIKIIEAEQEKPPGWKLTPTARAVLGGLADRRQAVADAAWSVIETNLVLLAGNQRELTPGYSITPKHLLARLVWERELATNTVPLEAARKSVADWKPAEVVAFAFALKAYERRRLEDEPLLLAADPNFPILLLRSVEQQIPDATGLWPRFLALTAPACPKTKSEWDKLAATGMW